MRRTKNDDLDCLYELLRKGTRVDEFLKQHSVIFEFLKSNNLSEDYRLARGKLKRLRDEITPIAHFIAMRAAPQDKIQFPLDSNIPDCNWYQESGGRTEIEVTIVQGRERYHLMTELNQTGEGRGFLGLTDDRPEEHFSEAMGQESRMYSTDEAKEAMKRAIALCVENKRHSRGDILLVEAPLGWLPENRWLELTPELAKLTEALSFPEIFLIGHRENDLCLKLR